MKKVKSAAPFKLAPPADTPEYLWPAYFSCLHWAVGSDEVHGQYAASTGNKFSPPKNPLDAMIDKAAGHDPAEVFFRDFVPWFNLYIWGPMDDTDEDE